MVSILELSMKALSLQEYIPDVAVLYSVDWLLGMIRTATNIWGDACACVVVDTWARRHAKKNGTLPIKVSPGLCVQTVLAIRVEIIRVVLQALDMLDQLYQILCACMVQKSVGFCASSAQV